MIPRWVTQEEALRFLSTRPRAMLQMHMGRGKSRVIVDDADERGAMRTLIVCPKKVIDAWPKQFTTFSVRTWEVADLWKGTSLARAGRAGAAWDRARKLKRPCAVIVNYDSARSDPFMRFIREYDPDYLVLDESHKLKSHERKAANRSAMSKIAVRVREDDDGCVRLLTGTPRPHGAMDIWGQFLCLDPVIFGSSYFRFRSRYAKMGGFKVGGRCVQIVGYQNLDDMARRMAAVTYIAGRDNSLPPVLHQDIFVNLCAPAMKAYRSLALRSVAEIGERELTAANGGVKVLRFQQLASGLARMDDGVEHVIDHEKRDALVDIIEGTDEPVVVFGRFLHDLRVTHEAAKIAGAVSLELSGATNELRDWQRGVNGARVLAVQIQAGAEGIDLTRSRYAVYLSTGHDGGKYDQSLARLDRPPQPGAPKRTEPLVVYHIHARGTMDRGVLTNLENKTTTGADWLGLVERYSRELQATS